MYANCVRGYALRKIKDSDSNTLYFERNKRNNVHSKAQYTYYNKFTRVATRTATEEEAHNKLIMIKVLNILSVSILQCGQERECGRGLTAMLHSAQLIC